MKREPIPLRREPTAADEVQWLTALIGEQAQRIAELEYLARLCSQFCGDVASGDVDDPAFRAEEVGREIERVLEEVGR